MALGFSLQRESNLVLARSREGIFSWWISLAAKSLENFMQLPWKVNARQHLKARGTVGNLSTWSWPPPFSNSAKSFPSPPHGAGSVTCSYIHFVTL